MGVALLIGAAFMLTTNLKLIPGGGDAIGFSRRTLVIAAIMNFLICGGNALGVGSYAPSRLVFSLLGINARRPHLPRPGQQVRGDRRARADAGGIPGVLIAAYIVKPLPVETIRWLVVAVVLYMHRCRCCRLRDRRPKSQTAADGRR